MKSKVELFDELIDELSVCNKCMNLDDKSLINIFENKDYCKNIPSIWTDWYNRLDSKIFIIGQDWGPKSDMDKLNECLESDSWGILIEKEKSSTKRNLTNFLIESSDGKINSLDNCYITNAIMCARYGNNYRGNNIDLKYSSICCSKFLGKQIEIVKPKVIITLGYYPLLALSKVFNFNIEKNLTETIKKYNIIEIDEYIIIPMYHPVAQISKSEQLKRYKMIWKYL